MKNIKLRRYLPIVILLAGLGITLTGYAAEPAEKATTAEIRQETTELLQALKAYGVEQRDAAAEQARAALANIDSRIASLENHMVQNWDAMDLAAREKAHASLQALRQQRTRVAEWYGGMKNSSASAWGHIKQGFSAAYRSLHDAWENSEKEFRPDNK